MKNLMLQVGRLLSAAVLLIGTATTALAEDDVLSQAELDQMLAPVALYPDTVLTHVLIAATYPLEIVQASRWVKANPGVTGEDAVRAVESKSWDPSVKALVAFPQLLERLSNDLDWTEQLGEAFLADETQVLASIQTLRQKAYANGSLNDNQHVVVERERDIIVIEPARKEVVYVPVYDTRVVYGDWWWPSYPPVYWHTAGVYYRNSPFYWGISVNVRPWFYFGIFDWHHRHVVVHHHYYHKPPRYYPKRHKHYVDARRWQHNTEHRHGVHYRRERLNREYNAGYGYRQPTRESQGKVVHQRKVTSDVREQHNQYQRKTAEQVRLPNQQWQSDDRNPRQHNEALRQQREQRLHTTDIQRNDRQPQQVQQQLKEQRQYNQQRERSNQVVSTEQLRQRQSQPQQRAERPQYKAEPQSQVQQNARQYQQPVAQQRQPQPVQAQQRQPAREYRASTKESMVQQRERPARHIE